MVGNDPEELRALAVVLRTTGTNLATTRQNLDARLASSSWVGDDADAFRTDWYRARRLVLAQASTMLQEASVTLIRNADEQDRASAADGGATGSRGSAGGGSAGDYVDQAYAQAGIDPDAWDPGAGVDGNRENIEAVYAYYAQLFRDHPELMWSGMAALIGPSFYAGFQDLDTFADLADLAGRLVNNPVFDRLPPGLNPADVFDRLFPPGVGPSLRELAEMSAEDIEAEFRWYETTFLGMQQEIFLDMAPQHEAYTTDGMTGIRTLLDDGMIDRATYDAWASIDEGATTGNTALIQQGNEYLLRREQSEIIRDQYDAMYQRQVTGPALTYLMTLVGQPSVPGAQGFSDVFPLTASTEIGLGPEDVYVGTPREVPIVGWGLPHIGHEFDNPVQGTLTITTPLPNGNIAHFDDRWALIEQDTLPAYQDMTREEVLEVLQTPVGERADELTIDDRIDDIVKDLVTDWQLDLDQ
jgi:hypothetical protein